MKKSKKITIGILIFFIVIAAVIGGRTAIGNHFAKKFSKRPPPGVIIEVVKEISFSQTIESYCTALSSQTISFKIKKPRHPRNPGAPDPSDLWVSWEISFRIKTIEIEFQ